MAKITKIEVQKNNKQKVNIYLDNEYYARMYLDTCVKYGLKSGIQIDTNKLDEIIKESEKNMALNLAVGYVSKALKTQKQVSDYLKKKEFNSDIIEYVLTKMIEYKYIDDEEYLSAYIRTYSAKFGINKLIFNLKSKGISKKLIDNYIQENEGKVDSFDTCLELAKKKIKDMDLNDIKNVQKVSRFLASRGFDFDDINKSIYMIRNGE